MGFWRPLNLFLLLFTLEVALFLAFSSIYNPSLSTYQGFTVEYNPLVYEPYPEVLVGIFVHNLAIATIDFIPILGAIFMVYSISNTGLVLSVIGSLTHTPGINLALYLFTLPHSWLELPSYAVASASGIYFVIEAANSTLSRAVIRLFYMYLMVAIELFIAASVEAGEIVDKPYGYLPYLYWIPAAFAFYFLIEFYKYFQKLADSS